MKTTHVIFSMCAAFAVIMAVSGCRTEKEAPTPAEEKPAARPTIKTVSSWSLYYGAATTDTVERLGGYGLVVIDPHALGQKSKETIAALKEKGCIVAGYLSFVEVAKWHRYRSRIPREWYILRDDGSPWNPWANKEVSWDANLAASLAEPGWRKMLGDLVQSEVLDYGCDGVFMDTLEDVDFHSMPEKEKDRQVEGLRLLMAELDERYPDAFFIGNRTLQRALDAVAPHIDAVCWESFSPKSFKDNSSRGWMEMIAKRLKDATDKYGVRVISLWNVDALYPEYEDDKAKVLELATERGYIHYSTVGGYSKLP